MKTVKYIILFLILGTSIACFDGAAPVGIFGLLVFFLLAGKWIDDPYKKKSIEEMTGQEFEYYCADILRQKGFKRIQVTPTTGDFGADIIAYDRWGNKWVFQCKRYSKSVGLKAVQEVNSAKAHYNASKGAVMTNSRLTKNAKRLAMENDIELFEMIGD